MQQRSPLMRLFKLGFGKVVCVIACVHENYLADQ